MANQEAGIRIQEFRNCRMGRLSDLRMAIHPLPCDGEFDSASRQFEASICLLKSCLVTPELLNS